MLFLAGLMGMALVGATVFISVDGGEESEDAVQPDAPQDTKHQRVYSVWNVG